ncbi:MAG: hypothetical protein ACPLUL_12565, partial [Thermanaerothrix sp.]|uniref:hypothetical protein n=1 Tax=Thermanaerothrix sp. TaxID=2972675 RepID=UPI003C7E1142
RAAPGDYHPPAAAVGQLKIRAMARPRPNSIYGEGLSKKGGLQWAGMFLQRSPATESGVRALGEVEAQPRAHWRGITGRSGARAGYRKRPVHAVALAGALTRGWRMNQVWIGLEPANRLKP